MELHVSTPKREISIANTNFELERDFIFTLKKLPVLWNPNNEYYNNKNQRLGALMILQNVYKRIKPDASVDDVKRKINIIRTNYRRELRKVEMSRSHGDVYEPKLWNFKYLHFLNVERTSLYSAIGTRESDDMLLSELVENSSGSQPGLQESCTDNDSEQFSSIVIKTDPLELPLTTSRNLIKVKTNLAKRNRLRDRGCASALAQTTLAQQQTPTKQCSSLALLWTEKLERLQPMQKLYAEKFIHDILFEAELGNLNRYSVKINESTVSRVPQVSVASPAPAPTPSSPSSSHQLSARSPSHPVPRPSTSHAVAGNSATSLDAVIHCCNTQCPHHTK